MSFHLPCVGVVVVVVLVVVVVEVGAVNVVVEFVSTDSNIKYLIKTSSIW